MSDRKHRNNRGRKGSSNSKSATPLHDAEPRAQSSNTSQHETPAQDEPALTPRQILPTSSAPILANGDFALDQISTPAKTPSLADGDFAAEDTCNDYLLRQRRDRI